MVAGGHSGGGRALRSSHTGRFLRHLGCSLRNCSLSLALCTLHKAGKANSSFAALMTWCLGSEMSGVLCYDAYVHSAAARSYKARRVKEQTARVRAPAGRASSVGSGTSCLRSCGRPGGLLCEDARER